MMDSARIDDEHKLIARYAQQVSLLENGSTPTRGVLDKSISDKFNSSENIYIVDSQHQLHQQLIQDLEAKNRQIMEEIAQLKQTKDTNLPNHDLMFELQMLKHHKGELENRMGQLHDGRKDLIEQLERLMTLLKSKSSYSPPAKPRISPPSIARLERMQNGTNEKHSNGPVTPSRTKSKFKDLFDAADAISDAMTDLVGQVSPQ